MANAQQKISMRILMVAAENGGLPGGKVGGMGDVVRDIPDALAKQGCRVDVLIPGYQHFSKLQGAKKLSSVDVGFGGGTEQVAVYKILEKSRGKVRYLALEHPLFGLAGAGKIYCDDPPHRPFASDATKFALFSAAVCEALNQGALKKPDILHLHDWHSALVAVLAKFDPKFKSLSRLHTVYTIHNLSLQGIRPFHGDSSSLAAWFPNLRYDAAAIKDPRYPECINPMRAAINLCDRIHAVSPNYAREICLPSNPEMGYVGGEGLEQDLKSAAKQNRLVGILNGCEYPRGRKKPDFQDFLVQAKQQVMAWIGANRVMQSAHFIAHQTILAWMEKPQPEFLVTSVGRLTNQKAQLLKETLPDGRSGMQAVLDVLAPDSAVIMLGSGDPDYEDFFTSIAARDDRLLFLRGYAETLSDQIYSLGELFLMPSSFEPCGISQMLAMRTGQPCLVHGVGGLLDTVKDGDNGFVFKGDSVSDQVQGMLTRFEEAQTLRNEEARNWKRVCTSAAKARFTWSAVATQYIESLYH